MPGTNAFTAEMCTPAGKLLHVGSPFYVPARPHHFLRGQRAASPGQTITGVSAASTEIQVTNRRAVSGPSEQWARDEQLIESELAVENVTARHSVAAFEVERCHRFARHDRAREPGRVAFDDGGRRIGEPIAFGIPGGATQVIRRILHVG